MSDPTADLQKQIAQNLIPLVVAGRGPAGQRAMAMAREAVAVALASGWEPPPPPAGDEGCRYCGRPSHGFPCWGLMQAAR